jgi:hypothetical protein
LIFWSCLSSREFIFLVISYSRNILCYPFPSLLVKFLYIPRCFVETYLRTDINIFYINIICKLCTDFLKTLRDKNVYVQENPRSKIGPELGTESVLQVIGHRLSFYVLKNTTCKKLDFFPFSCERVIVTSLVVLWCPASVVW